MDYRLLEVENMPHSNPIEFAPPRRGAETRCRLATDAERHALRISL